jgi:hypothetical protein
LYCKHCIKIYSVSMFTENTSLLSTCL